MDNIHPASIKINKVLEGLIEVHPASINPQITKDTSIKLFMFLLFALLIIYIIKRYVYNNKKK